MVMRSLRNGASGGFMKYILFGILGMSVGGLVVMDVRGVLGGGGVGASDVAKIEDHSINIREFDRTLRMALTRYRVTQEQAHSMGLTNEILTSEIQKYFLINEAEDIGIEISQDQVAKNIAEIIKPQMREDQTLQQALDEILRARQMAEKDFVSTIKREVSSNLIMEAVRAGFRPDQSLLMKELQLFEHQTRDVEVVVLPNDDIQIVEPATDEQLSRLYESLKALNYKIPEYRAADVALLDPAKMEVEVNVSDEDARLFYNGNQDSFRIGEQLVLTQSVSRSKDVADKVYAVVQTGQSLGDAVKAVDDAATRYVSGIPFETASMMASLDEALSDRALNKPTAPIKTSLGYHIVILDEVLAPSIKPFQQVKARLIKELEDEQKSEEMYQISLQFDEALNDEKSFDEIAQSIAVERGQIALTTQNDNADAFAAFDDKDRDALKTLLFESSLTDPPSLQELPSGKFAALLVTDRKAESFKPYESVKEDIQKQFIADQKSADNEMRVQKFLAEIKTGGSTLQTIAASQKKDVQKLDGITVRGALPDPLQQDSLPQVFKTPMNGHVVLEVADGYALLKIANSDFTDVSGDNADIKKAKADSIQQQLSEEAGDEAFLMYMRGLGRKYTATVNQRLLDQVYGGNARGSGAQ